MAKYSTIKCWHVSDTVTDPEEVRKESPTLNIIKKSILKHGYRGYAIEDRETIESQNWYKPFLLGDEVRFYIDGSGVYRLINCDLTENELYFERLNVPVGYRPWVFYSWQSDFNPSRTKIKDALDEAVEHINTNLNPRQPLEIVEATRPEDGAKDIIQAIKSNIDRCMFSVFDITNVSKVVQKDDSKKSDTEEAKPKYYPNANVVFELSYALAKKKPDQILLARANRKKELKNEAVPFDFEHNKRIDFEKPSTIKKQLCDILTAYLKRYNFIQSD